MWECPCWEQRKNAFEVTGQYTVTVKSVSPYNNQFPMLVKDLKHWKKAGCRVVLLSASRTRAARLAENLREEGLNAFYSAERRSGCWRPGEILVMHGSAP